MPGTWKIVGKWLVFFFFLNECSTNITASMKAAFISTFRIQVLVPSLHK